MSSRTDTRRKGHYRPDARAEIDAIEKRRKALGVPVAELAAAAQMSDRWLHAVRKTGLAWPRQVRALKGALRTLEAEARRAGGMFPGGE